MGTRKEDGRLLVVLTHHPHPRPPPAVLSSLSFSRSKPLPSLPQTHLRLPHSSASSAQFSAAAARILAASSSFSSGFCGICPWRGGNWNPRRAAAGRAASRRRAPAEEKGRSCTRNCWQELLAATVVRAATGMTRRGSLLLLLLLPLRPLLPCAGVGDLAGASRFPAARRRGARPTSRRPSATTGATRCARPTPRPPSSWSPVSASASVSNAAGSTSCRNSTRLRGAAAGVWRGTTSGAGRPLWSLKEKVRTTAGRRTRVGGCRTPSLPTPPTSISRSDKMLIVSSQNNAPSLLSSCGFLLRVTATILYAYCHVF
uniref:Uncharacterized protein n=1 Tax=Anthurium amnicola TaxID=1678845 RepID=A0A1D1YNI9_9ARAE